MRLCGKREFFQKCQRQSKRLPLPGTQVPLLTKEEGCPGSPPARRAALGRDRSRVLCLSSKGPGAERSPAGKPSCPQK